MKSQEEIQLSHDLREIVAGQPFEPDVEAIERRGHHLRRRSIAVRSVTVLGVALVAGLAIAVHGGAPGPATSKDAGPAASKAAGPAASKAAGAATSKPPVETVGYVTARVQAALGNWPNLIIQDTQVSPATTELTDPRTGNTYLLMNVGADRTATWQHIADIANTLNWLGTTVDYSNHTWYTDDVKANGPLPPGGLPKGPYGGAAGTPAQLKQRLADGGVRIVGHGRVNGHNATELRMVWAVEIQDIWVDSQTFQPVRLVQSITRGVKGLTSTYNETWMPRSAAMANLTNHPRIPAGFTRVPGPQ